MIQNAEKFFDESYRRFGPAFRIAIPGRKLTVFAGPEANEFFDGEGAECLAAGPSYRNFYSFLRMKRFPLALDGDEHRRVRRAYTAGYARAHFEKALPTAISIVESQAEQATHSQQLDLLHFLRQVVALQVGAVCLGAAPGSLSSEAFDALSGTLRDLMQVYMEQSRPRITLLLRRTSQKRKAVEQFAARLLEGGAKQSGVQNGRSNLLAEVIGAGSGGSESVDDLRGAIVGTYFAAIDNVACTMAFTLAEILSRTDLSLLVMKEADAFQPSNAAKVFSEAPNTIAILRETMRLHAVASILPRVAAHDFDFNGYQIKSGTQALIATAVAHRLESLHPQPPVFDHGRFMCRKPFPRSAYAPFGVGPHACAAIGFAELQMAVTILSLFRSWMLKLGDQQYRIDATRDPHPSPRNLKVIISRRCEAVPAF